MKKLPIVVLCFLLFSCAEKGAHRGDNSETSATNSLGKVSWILGNWYMDTPEGTITEVWAIGSDSSYAGTGMMTTAKGDTVFTEHIRLVADAGALWYIPTVSGQNNGEEVRFKEKTITDTEVVFENPEHDFPQRIVYHKLSDSTVVASIEGMQDGKMRKEEFSYRKR